MYGQQSTTTPEVPLACLLGDGAEREARLQEIEHLFRQARAVEEIADGYIIHFAYAEGRADELLNFVAAEHRCCPFLTFELRIGPASADLTLYLSGSQPVKEFIAAFLASLVSGSDQHWRADTPRGTE